MTAHKIIWTKIDEAPALATYGLLPVVQAYANICEVDIETKDISLAGRIIANFPDHLTDAQQLPDALTELGELAKTAQANIIKLPNISASVGQLKLAIKELQDKGYDIPKYPEAPSSPGEVAIKKQYAKILGSAVNPVLREGNSDRRAATSVKNFAQKNPHKMMKPWPSTGSKTRVAHMTEKDFYASEKSAVIKNACTANIEFTGTDGTKQILKEKIALQAGEIIDSATMNVAALKAYFAKEIIATKDDDALLSLHLKATMMKVSDPIMFGHCVSVFYKSALEKHRDHLFKIGANVNNGLADVLNKLTKLSPEIQAEIEADIAAVYDTSPHFAMVDSRKGVTNLHLPNNIIIDASMPNVVRDGGKMWDKADQLVDTVCLIPDRCYATIYQAVITDCQKHGQFDPATMGSVANVGLMAQKAEEYGSHDKTFTAPDNGAISVVDSNGTIILKQTVAQGDLFRACQTKDAPIRDWIRLAVARAKASGSPTIFWLDKLRGHDAEIIKKINTYLPEHDTKGCDIQIMTPIDAMVFSLERIRKGKNTISVTGNVLRDYLTDLFPILELGTSARMLSIVPLMNGGGLFETGAGGSAPKHVEQFLNEGHLRWDSLGEYCAIVPSLEKLAETTGNQKAQILADALDNAISVYLENSKSPSRKVNEIDNRGSAFYLAMYWASTLATQTEDQSLADRFKTIASQLKENEDKITKELLNAQGAPVDIGGYFLPDITMVEKAMRPSATLNEIINGINAG